MRKKSILFLFSIAAWVLLICSLSWGQCPEDPKDKGTCDTLYVEPYSYAAPGSYPADIEIAMRVTHDVPDPSVDSLSGFVIPLCFTSSNAAANATIDPLKNVCGAQDLTRIFHPAPFNLNNSVFQDLPNMESPTELNWMMDLSDRFGPEWDTRILDLSVPGNFWLSVVATGTTDEAFPAGSRVLIATMTITIDDTTTLCIDSCFWPPTARLQFSNYNATVFIPRHNLPFCYISSDVREIPEFEDSRPSEFSLSQNYPNPFNPATNFEFNVSKVAHVKLDIFNIVGQKVKTLVDEEMKPGKYVVDWDGKDENGHSVSSGIYFYRLQAADFSDIKKMLLVK